MYKKVMWPTDGSEIANRALPHAKMLAADGGGVGITVVHCEEFTLPGRGGRSLLVHANEEEIQAKIERQVASYRAAAGVRRLRRRVARSAALRMRSPRSLGANRRT